jgi:hypothetical protein
MIGTAHAHNSNAKARVRKKHVDLNVKLSLKVFVLKGNIERAVKFCLNVLE